MHVVSWFRSLFGSKAPEKKRSTLLVGSTAPEKSVLHQARSHSGKSTSLRRAGATVPIVRPES